MTTRWLPSHWIDTVLYTHRWLGIAGGLLFLMWFVSGMVMMYARMPELTTAERLTRLSGLDLSTARMDPAEAARRAALSPERVRIAMLGDRPVYQFAEGPRRSTVFADSGQPLGGLTRDQATDLARRFAPQHVSTLRYDAYLTEADQWTLQLPALLPMHRLSLGDSEDTVVYLSDRTGEAVMKTTRRSRSWAYLGAVPHWIYFTKLRRHRALWARVVIWLSIAGCLLALTGLGWGWGRFSPGGRYRVNGAPSRSPYSGLMRYHHYAGLLFGLTTFTWILSGCLSMDPWNWHPGSSPTAHQREAVAGGSLRLSDLTTTDLLAALGAMASSLAPKELEVVQFQGQLFLIGYGVPWPEQTGPATGGQPAALRASSLPIAHLLVSVRAAASGPFKRFDEDVLLAAARAAMPATALQDAVWLRQYDAYYYDRDGKRPLPVLRVRYRDAQGTWLYLDPGRGVIVQKEEQLSRANRWLYRGLHSFDFPFLYRRRPLWDVIVIVLSLGGILLSASSMIPGWQRLGRRIRRRSQEGEDAS